MPRHRHHRSVLQFVGITNDAAGTPMTIFSITNRGVAKVVIWGYYGIDAKQQFAVRHRTIFSEHYSFLAPGQSQTATVYAPETRGSWKVSIGYGSYNLQCRWVVCDYFVASSISLSIVHVSVASFKPTAGVQPSVL